MAQKDRGTLGMVTVATPSLSLGGLTNMAQPTGTEIITPRSTSVDPEFISVMSSRAQVSFTSMSIAEILAAVGQSGLECTTLKSFFQRSVPYGARASANVDSVAFAKAYLIPRTINANEGETATIDLLAHAISADGTDPVTTSKADTLPAGSAVDEAFTIGPLSINGDSYDLETGSLDYGITEIVEANEGGAYATQAWIENRNTIFTFGARTTGIFADLGIAGEELTVFSWYLRKMLGKGKRVPDITAEHIKFTATGYVHPTDSTASPNARQNTAITITPIGPITIDEASAIT